MSKSHITGREKKYTDLSVPLPTHHSPTSIPNQISTNFLFNVINS